jgi:hypothetical protein
MSAKIASSHRSFPDWLGLAIVALMMLVLFAIRALEFQGEISEKGAAEASTWCFGPMSVGFVLHMIAVVRRIKKRKIKDTGPSGESSD